MPRNKLIKKVLLINPPAIVKQSWDEDVSSFPLGLAYIAAVLENSNIEVEILDCFMEDFFNRNKIDDRLMRLGMSDDAIIHAVAQSAPHLVGISIPFSCQLSSAINMNSLIKSVDKSIITVAGGAHITNAPGSIRDSAFNWIVLGEGEYRLLELIKAINDNIQVSIPGVIGLDGATPHRALSLSGNFIKDLDALPVPLYGLLPLKKYWESCGKRRVNMIATRGCPNICVFCTTHTLMGRRVRHRSVDNVLKEMVSLKSVFDIEQVFFEDDNLTCDMEWAKELFRKIVNENLNIEIYMRNGIRADRVDLELLQLMKSAGVRRVWFAPESGSQETLDKIIKKDMRLEDCEKAVQMAKGIGLDVTCFLVIGFPEETMEDIRQTIQYGYILKKLGCDTIWLSCASPYPGSELFNDCAKRGLISEENPDYQSISTMDSIIYNDHFSSDQIKRIRDQAMRDLNPLNFKQRLKRIQKNIVLLFLSPSLFAKKLVVGLTRYAMHRMIVYIILASLMMPNNVYAGTTMYTGLFGLWSWDNWNEALQIVKDNGFNIAVEVPVKQHLERAQQLGLQCLVGMGITKEIVNDENRMKKYLDSVRQKVTEFKGHPAVYAWYIADEPDLQEIPVEAIKIVHDLIRSIDRGKPLFAVLTVPEKWSAYLPYFDIISIDPYLKKKMDGTHEAPQKIKQWLQKLRDDLKKQDMKKPVWVTLGAFELKPKDTSARFLFERPTPGEFRDAVDMALGEKVEGILVYTLGFPGGATNAGWNLPRDAPELWNEVKKLPQMVKDAKN